MKSILAYINYREFLKDWVAARKSEGLPGSNRWFAQKMALNSSSWLSAILAGKRNLNSSHRDKLSSVLKLTPLEHSYFCELVGFSQADSTEAQSAHFSRMKRIRERQQAHTVDGNFYEYYSQWYHSAIRALVGLTPLRGDEAVIGALLVPPISEQKAQESLALLERTGLIERDKEGYFALTHASITTGDYERSEAIRTFQEQTLNLAKGTLHRGKREQKDISTLTLGISHRSIDRVKAILSQARKEIAAIAEGDDDADMVYQLNMQLFPFSQEISEDS